MTTKKYLCICDWGQVRSVAMAQYIHELNGTPRIKKVLYEAIPIGAVVSSKKTMKIMKKWADVVIDVRQWLPSDLWHNPRDPDLKIRVEQIFKEVTKNEK